jgi:hypothetical protein
LVRFGAAALALVGFLSASPRACADTITLKLETDGTPVAYNPYGGPTMIAHAGPYQWSQVPPLNANFPPAVSTFCIDKDQFIYVGESYTFTIESNLALAPTIGDETKAGLITELYDRYYLSTLTDVAAQQAFQLALWDLVHDGPDGRGMSEGRIQANNPQAQNMLSSLGTPYSNHDLAGLHLLALVSETNQDQLVVVPDPVPAPPGVILASIGVLALLGRAYRNRRPPAA